MYNIAEIEIIYHPKYKMSERPQVSNSQDIYDILFPVWGVSLRHYETFNVLLLNNANKVLGIKRISTGGVNSCLADPKIIFQAAIAANASSIILAHNHPSGNLKPSQADLQLTTKIKEAGRLLDITCLDHLIITDEGYYSFADEGLM